MRDPGDLATVADIAPSGHRIFSDPRGSLVPVELASAVPFPVTRIFWVFDVPKDGLRGGHAHRFCSQYLLCMRGAIEIMVDDGADSTTFQLQAGSGLLIPPAIWASERYLTADTTLLVLCSHAYDVEDYIDDKDELRALRKAWPGEPR